MRGLSLGLLLLLLSPIALADTQYADAGTWHLFSGPTNSVSFAGYGGSPDQFYGAGLTVNGVNFLGSGGYLVVRCCGGPAPGGPELYGAPFSDIVVTLPYSTRAVGWNFGNFYGSGITVTLSDGTTFVRSDGDSNAPGFIGIVTNTPITSLDISSPYYSTMNGFEFGSEVSQTPEPANLVLFGSGLAGITGIVRRKFFD